MEFLFVLAIPLIFFFATSVRIMKEYQRGVVYTLGRYTHTTGPGLIILIPIVQQMTTVDLRVLTEDVPAQDVISKDNISVRVSAVVYYRVVEPANAINKVENYFQATSELAQTTLRSVLGKHELDDMLAQRDKLNGDIQQILDKSTEGWGIKVVNVEIKNLDIDPSMIRAIGKQAEAERERRAKIISAEGEFQAAKQLDAAAEIMAKRPETMQLRYLSTLQEISNEKTNTIVMPIPDILAKMVGK
jgi:regulator of protease activity HflC (stomatin/prohibitin superfamily)